MNDSNNQLFSQGGPKFVVVIVEGGVFTFLFLALAKSSKRFPSRALMRKWIDRIKGKIDNVKVVNSKQDEKTLTTFFFHQDLASECQELPFRELPASLWKKDLR